MDTNTTTLTFHKITPKNRIIRNRDNIVIVDSKKPRLIYQCDTKIALHKFSLLKCYGTRFNPTSGIEEKHTAGGNPWLYRLDSYVAGRTLHVRGHQLSKLGCRWTQFTSSLSSMSARRLTVSETSSFCRLCFPSLAPQLVCCSSLCFRHLPLQSSTTFDIRSNA